jgi:uncharacterized coiled-coil DUF342 family protein
MSEWERINKVFSDADKLRQLEALYMERGNVTPEQARQWALEKFNEPNQPPAQDQPSDAEIEKIANHFARVIYGFDIGDRSITPYQRQELLGLAKWHYAATETLRKEHAEHCRATAAVLNRRDEQLEQLRMERDELQKQLKEKLAGILSIRCTPHWTVPMHNKNEFGGAECGGCIIIELNAYKASINTSLDNIQKLGFLGNHQGIDDGVNSMYSQLTTAHATIADLKTKCITMEHDNAALRAERDAALARVKQLEHENDVWSKSSLTKTVEDNERLTKERDAAHARIAELSQGLNQCRCAISGYKMTNPLNSESVLAKALDNANKLLSSTTPPPIVAELKEAKERCRVLREALIAAKPRVESTVQPFYGEPDDVLEKVNAALAATAEAKAGSTHTPPVR